MLREEGRGWRDEEQEEGGGSKLQGRVGECGEGR